MTVILNPDNSLPEAFGVVIVKTGGKNDPPDATGLAHYMEHMLFKGTQQLGTTDWEKEKPHIDRIFQLYEELGNSTLEADRKRIQTEINEESLKAAEFAIPNEMSNLINSIGGTNLNAGTGPDWTIFYNKFPSSQIFKWIDLYVHYENDPNTVHLGRYDFGPVVSDPIVTAKVKLQKKGTLIALSYCNLHGLWESKKEINLE